MKIEDSKLGTAFEAISLFSGATRSQRIMMALWAGAANTFDSFGVTPRVFFGADGPGSGKTVNMQVTTALVPGSINVGYSSQASVYDYLDDHPGTTLGLDETDKIFGIDGRKTSRAVLAAVINDGYTSKGNVMVMRNGSAVFMPVFTPIAMAGIGTLPKDTLDRCLVIKLEKSQPGETYIPYLHEDGMRMIGNELKQWLVSKNVQKSLRASAPIADINGDPRERLIMAPLQAVAEIADCLDEFKTAMREIQTGIQENAPTPLHELFISDLRELWPDTKVSARLTAREIIDLAREHPSRRWAKMDRTRLGEVTVAGLLRQSSVQSRVSNGKRAYARRDVFGGSDGE